MRPNDGGNATQYIIPNNELLLHPSPLKTITPPVYTLEYAAGLPILQRPFLLINAHRHYET